MPYFDYDHVTHQLHESVQNTSLQKIAMAGTGLTPLTNSPTAHGTIEGPLVLELVHLTEIGVSALALEGIRQERAISSTSVAYRRGERLQEQEQILPEYPRERLKLVLTDGFNELEAIECGRLPDIVLGKTPMGTKVRLLIPLVSTWYI
ncbi:hypothetical protein FA13DRAFT_1653252 [Coprinellus micaceus]|uniref:RecQ mediated genome instability protein 1 OB-fold domain-containing protein n=1 Tax=Coprinellus micaceus TaxID=71717 RepID=A0A4Y7RMU7_COPMI|nr:hypothetical protein FA13DRAFT_1653252 [Coprinellus micaceus]